MTFFEESYVRKRIISLITGNSQNRCLYPMSSHERRISVIAILK